MTDKNILDKGRKVIEIELGAVKELVERIDESFVEAARLIYNSSGRVVFTGMGKSG